MHWPGSRHAVPGPPQDHAGHGAATPGAPPAGRGCAGAGFPHPHGRWRQWRACRHGRPPVGGPTAG
ncbi:MAG: hypothetical protein EBR46_05955 [Betaproteobacteria bacterium]|nr:hypothetical protein [Betaproteobacteria bacterium]